MFGSLVEKQFCIQEIILPEAAWSSSAFGLKNYNKFYIKLAFKIKAFKHRLNSIVLKSILKNQFHLKLYLSNVHPNIHRIASTSLKHFVGHIGFNQTNSIATN